MVMVEPGRIVPTNGALGWQPSLRARGHHDQSGLGYYRIPVSIIRQPRSSLGGLPPDIPWPGAMDDDQGLQQWIAGLATSGVK